MAFAKVCKAHSFTVNLRRRWNGDGWACLAFHTPHAIRMGVWRLEGTEERLTIPLKDAVRDVRVLYPSTFDGEIGRTDEGVSMTLPRKATAVLLECK